jgi:hypothetical protein
MEAGIARDRPRARLGAHLGAAIVSAAAAWLVLIDIHGPARPILELTALVAGTGWALTGWMKLGEPAYAGAVAVAAGAAFLVLASILCVERDWWHPVGLSVCILLGATILNVVHALREAVVTP